MWYAERVWTLWILLISLPIASTGNVTDEVIKQSIEMQGEKLPSEDEDFKVEEF
jgi:hypothetical protein